MRILPALFCGLALAASSLAQPPPPGPGAADELVRMQFPNAEVADILRLYEQLTGKRLVYDNTVSGPLNIVIAQRVPKAEAIRIIEINLLLNGFTLVPAEGGIVKVIGLGKNARTAGVPVLSSPEPIPEGARVITYLFKLRFADPVELAQTLTPYIAATANYTAIVPLPKASALLVTESTDVLEGLRRIIAEIDVPPAEVVSEFIKLERADALEVLEKLNAIFEQPQQGGAGAARSRVVNAAPSPEAPGQPPGAEQVTSVIIQPGTLTEDSVVVGKIRLTADERTNRIHIVTRPVNLPFVRGLIAEFDTSTSFSEPARRLLKFVSAQDVLPVVVQTLTEPGQKVEQTTPDGGGQQGQPGARGAANRSTGGGGSSGGDGIDISEGLSTEPIETAPEAATIGNSRIIADNRANAIIVIGTEEVKEKVFRLLDQLDVRAPQVMLSTVIGELELGENQEFGIDYLLRFTGGSNSILQPVTPGTPGTPATPITDPVTGVVTDTPAVPGTPGAANVFRGGIAGVTRNTNAPLLDAASLGTAAAFGNLPGGLSAFVSATDSLDGIVRALESTRHFRVTSRPMVFTSNNKKAIIVSGQEIAVPTQTLTGTTGVNGSPSVSSNVQFKRVALQLEVVPLINSDREVSLDILQKVDSVVPGSSTVVGGTAIPTIATRYIRTHVSVANQATLVLGGLITRDQSRGESGIPLLGRIPILGYLFKTTTKAKTRRELIVLIRPVVTTSPVETILTKEMEQDRLLIEPDLEASLDAPRSDPRNRYLLRAKPPLRTQ